MKKWTHFKGLGTKLQLTTFWHVHSNKHKRNRVFKSEKNVFSNTAIDFFFIWLWLLKFMYLCHIVFSLLDHVADSARWGWTLRQQRSIYTANRPCAVLSTEQLFTLPAVYYEIVTIFCSRCFLVLTLFSCKLIEVRYLITLWALPLIMLCILLPSRLSFFSLSYLCKAGTLHTADVIWYQQQ